MSKARTNDEIIVLGRKYRDLVETDGWKDFEIRLKMKMKNLEFGLTTQDLTTEAGRYRAIQMQEELKAYRSVINTIRAVILESEKALVKEAKHIEEVSNG